MRTGPATRRRRAVTGPALALLAAVGTVAACSGPGPGEKDVEYDSLDALHEAATTAGLTCLSFVPEDSGTPDVELGTCDDTTLLAVFAGGVEEAEFLRLLPVEPSEEEQAALAGPNWVVVGDTGDLLETKAGIGGDFLSDR
ncbi:hypothetical protein GJV82_07310 [Cellulosimicrobium sp. BIT-GX5]|uniref:Lipoprotein n=1 Tax=Cellulosimicrobium composti TaxID=2672572 RepID=A0A6N7ZHI8_9MICO|nr:hypothetical protein [Cellulosimicrobium composti]MTG88750.1 hypothetical protein [Cellulosimicrobium composti]TWG86826.1 hypothetical protein L603_001200000230 [Cellulosimicrobium cellulans J34]SMF10787.1 hypothetical protein SAMN02744115_01430 [Cellulosimicrobium cellulans J1]